MFLGDKSTKKLIYIKIKIIIALATSNSLGSSVHGCDNNSIHCLFIHNKIMSCFIRGRKRSFSLNFSNPWQYMNSS